MARAGSPPTGIPAGDVCDNWGHPLIGSAPCVVWAGGYGVVRELCDHGDTGGNGSETDASLTRQRCLGSLNRNHEHHQGNACTYHSANEQRQQQEAHESYADEYGTKAPVCHSHD